jgi:hypothetical protein
MTLMRWLPIWYACVYIGSRRVCTCLHMMYTTFHFISRSDCLNFGSNAEDIEGMFAFQVCTGHSWSWSHVSLHHHLLTSISQCLFLWQVLLHHLCLWCDLICLASEDVKSRSDLACWTLLLMCLTNESLSNDLLIGPLHCIGVDVIVLVYAWSMGPMIVC